MTIGPRILRTLAALAVVLPALLLPAGCAGGGSRGRVSDTAARAADEGRTGRGTGRTRTRTDHEERPRTDSRPAEADHDDGDSFLFDLVVGLFSGGDDDDETVSDPAWAGGGAGGATGAAGGAGEVGGASAPRAAGGGGGAGNRPQRRNVIAWYARSDLAGDAIDGFDTWAAAWSRYRGPRLRDHLGLFYGSGRRGGQAAVRDGIDRIEEFGVDLGSRRYLTALHTFTGVYALYGVRLSSLHWAYATTVPVEGATTSISVDDDGTFIVTPYAGLGCALVQVLPLHFGASVNWGPRLSLFDNTYKGFTNDLFVNAGELRWSVEVSVFF